ncbi:GNAT family N-acetyltransferase [Streptomyces violaceusniger]|uniref:GNAT family N-acetyltransferase n=1 Tax=Streptomyces violaceusniger TaxID=68280 RepID=UPI00380BC884
MLPTAPGQPVSADIAVAVAEGRHGHGIGTLLLEHLVHAAREAVSPASPPKRSQRITRC